MIAHAGEDYCWKEYKAGRLRLLRPVDVEVVYHGDWLLKVPQFHEISGRTKYRFGKPRWVVYRSRLLWMPYNQSRIPDDCVIDHIDGNRLNDDPNNLQLMNVIESHRQGNQLTVDSTLEQLSRWFEFVSTKGRYPTEAEEYLQVEIGF